MESMRTSSEFFTFIRKHFNGDYSLGRSYWVNTFLITVFASKLGILIVGPLTENLPARYGSASVLLVTATGLLVWGWAISGTWASANKHVSRGGKPLWAVVARLVIILGVFKTFWTVSHMTGPLREHWSVALGHQLGPEVKFELRADGYSILLKGGINDGTAEALSKVLDTAPSITTVVLYSKGGWVRQGAMIAKLISDRHLNTYVERECTSACTIAFLAGKERTADPKARIGFHSFSTIGSNGKMNEYDRDSVEITYHRAGLPSSFIQKIVATPPQKVWYPSYDEMVAAGVLTRSM